jgi:quinol-cytochrome oxidoreductase complex cytochrome b subunit
MFKRLRTSRIWKSIFREPWPKDRVSRVRVVLENFFLHIHPPRIRVQAIRPGFTWYLGAIAFYLFVFETITGVLLMFYFRPTVEWAYLDMLNLRESVSLGILREMHRWGAHAMVIVVWLHMLRVFLTGSYKPPRQFNWVLGVFLLVLTMLLSFTGYLLPWDQLSMWAVTVGSNMARAAPLIGHEGPGQQLLESGGTDLVTDTSDARYVLLGSSSVGPETLNRFYVLHCVAIPLVAALLIALHFWRIRKDGGISLPDEDLPEKRDLPMNVEKNHSRKAHDAR